VRWGVQIKKPYQFIDGAREFWGAEGEGEKKIIKTGRESTNLAFERISSRLLRGRV